MKGVFWLSLSVALVTVAASVCYFLIVYVPSRDRVRDRQAAEIAQTESVARQETECAAQAARATEQFARELLAMNLNHEVVADSMNHYNKPLKQCFVEIQTIAKGGATADYILDAIENKQVQVCTFDPQFKGSDKRLCLDADNAEIAPRDADKQSRSLMTR